MYIISCSLHQCTKKDNENKNEVLICKPLKIRCQNEGIGSYNTLVFEKQTAPVLKIYSPKRNFDIMADRGKGRE